MLLYANTSNCMYYFTSTSQFLYFILHFQMWDLPFLPLSKYLKNSLNLKSIFFIGHSEKKNSFLNGWIMCGKLLNTFSKSFSPLSVWYWRSVPKVLYGSFSTPRKLLIYHSSKYQRGGEGFSSKEYNILKIHTDLKENIFFNFYKLCLFYFKGKEN